MSPSLSGGVDMVYLGEACRGMQRWLVEARAGSLPGVKAKAGYLPGDATIGRCAAVSNGHLWRRGHEPLSSGGVDMAPPGDTTVQEADNGTHCSMFATESVVMGPHKNVCGNVCSQCVCERSWTTIPSPGQG